MIKEIEQQVDNITENIRNTGRYSKEESISKDDVEKYVFNEADFAEASQKIIAKGREICG